MTKKTAFYFLMAIVIATFAVAQTKENLVVRIALLKKVGSKYESQSFSRTVQMKENDMFQVAVESSANSYCYILYEGSGNEYILLAKTELKPDMPLYLPSEQQVFTVSPPKGIEMIHIVISGTTQTQLESLLNNTKPGETIVNRQKVADEIFRLRQNLSSIAEAPEKPAAMGGVYRNLDENNSFELSGQKYYVKTISVRH